MVVREMLLHRLIPVSYTHLDVYKRQIQRGVLNTSSAKANEYGTCSDFERYFVDVHDRKLTWSQFEDKVKELETVNTDWFKYLFRNAITPVSYTHLTVASTGSSRITPSTTHKGCTFPLIVDVPRIRI